MTEKKDPKPYEVNFAPQAGYDFLERWGLKKELYKNELKGQNITKISIWMEEGRPTIAKFYRDGKLDPNHEIKLEGKLEESMMSEEKLNSNFMKSLVQINPKGLKKLKIN
jgi:hypothetical protein